MLRSRNLSRFLSFYPVPASPGPKHRSDNMRKLILAAAVAATARRWLWPPPADAQGRTSATSARLPPRSAQCRHSRREYRRERRECAPRHRPGPQPRLAQLQPLRLQPPRAGRSAYYADDYYRDGRYYRERRLSHNDRIYRGRDGRYYCRRNDGTTGLIIGAGVGALIGHSIDDGRSSTARHVARRRRSAVRSAARSTAARCAAARQCTRDLRCR